MPSAKRSPESEVNPPAPAEHLAHWLVQTTMHTVLGLTIGMIAARVLRRRHLHWSWAGVGLAWAALAHALLAGLSTTVGIATLSAALVGRRWHRHDVASGADLAKLATARSTPVGLLRALVWRLAVRRRRRGGVNSWFRGGELMLGCDERSRMVSIPCGRQAGGTHTLVVGATGSGKTVTQTWIAVRAIEGGMAAVAVDPKGDRRLRDEICIAARTAGRAFIEWTPDGPSVYNPYASGGETQIADKALAGERFTEPHYLRQAQRYMGHVVRALRSCGHEVSLRGIVEQLDPAELELLARNMHESEAQGTHSYLDSLTPRQRGDLAGVRDRLAILAESDVGRWLDPDTLGAPRFDLLGAVLAGTVVYFNLESDRRPLLAQMLGAAIVQDLQTTVAELQSRPVPTLVLIDEFSAVAAEQVVRLFGRARSAGFSLLLGTQELSDLRLPGRESVLEQVMGNLSTLIAHRQVVPHSAELIASLAGSKGAWRASHRSDGASTRTRTRTAVLDTEEVMHLMPGWAAVIVLAGRGGAPRVARIFAP
jgi:hypothetical protein